MALKIDEIITDPYILREGYIIRDGFVFTSGQENAIYNRIVVRHPQRARADETRMGYSYRTLDEHVELINTYQIESALLICKDLSFISSCPSLKDISVCPSYDADESFDYTMLKNIPHLKTLACRTTFGDYNQHHAEVDYSSFSELENISMVGSGHKGFGKLPALTTLWFSGNKSIRDLTSISSPMLQDLTFLQCRIETLNGLELHPQMKSLTLWHNRSLYDISALKAVGETLTELSIEACGKIKDFSVLSSLINLEYLYLEGNNTLPSLSFLNGMKKLKVFVFSMNIEDGDLTSCMKVPYVRCKNRKHYNLKDKNLPKICPKSQ